jgi:hypothetical protein
MQEDMSKAHSGDAVEGGYWTTIIGANNLTSSKDVREALIKVKARLAATSPAEMAAFDQWLHEQIYQLDRKEFFEAPIFRSDSVVQRQSEDHFLYARCACVLAGHFAYGEVVTGRRNFSDYAAIPLQGAELLLYVAEEVCEEVFDIVIDRREFLPLEAGSNSKYWI